MMKHFYKLSLITNIALLFFTVIIVGCSHTNAQTNTTPSPSRLSDIKPQTNAQTNTDLCNESWYSKATPRDIQILLKNGASANETCIFWRRCRRLPYRSEESSTLIYKDVCDQYKSFPLALAIKNNASPSVILELLNAGADLSGADLYFDNSSNSSGIPRFRTPRHRQSKVTSSGSLSKGTPMYTLVDKYCKQQRNKRKSVCDKVRAEVNKSICKPMQWRNIYNGEYSIKYLRHLIFINADCGKGNRPLHIALQELPITPLKRSDYENLVTLMDLRNFNPSIKNNSGQSITDLLKLRFGLESAKTNYSNLLQELCSDRITFEEYNSRQYSDHYFSYSSNNNHQDYYYEWRMMKRLPNNKNVSRNELLSKLKMEIFGTNKDPFTLQKKDLCAKHKS